MKNKKGFSISRVFPAIAHNGLGLYAGWDFSTKVHKKYKCLDLHKCLLKVHQPTLRKTRVVRSCLVSQF